MLIVVLPCIHDSIYDQSILEQYLTKRRHSIVSSSSWTNSTLDRVYFSLFEEYAWISNKLSDPLAAK